jgi:nucleoid-associated protein YgaU
MKDPALLEISDQPFLAAFAAVMLGASPLDPPDEARKIAAMASRLAEPRPARRPGDVEATRAYRSVYALSRGQETGAPSVSEPVPTKAAIVLRTLLSLRHRQRAALALRYVFGLPPDGVARVLGLSPAKVAEVARAGAANISKTIGARVDVGRHLRSTGTLLRESPPERSATRPAGEPRSVVRLLLAPTGRTDAEPGPVPRPRRIAARPVYDVRAARLGPPTPPPPAPPPSPEIAAKKPRRVGLLAAACVAALTFLGAFVPTALLRPAVRTPLAAIPIAPALSEAVAPAPGIPAVFDYRVRTGDTLWSIAGSTLGDPGRWTELWRSNRGRLMADGARLEDPDVIRPGWRLRLTRE